MEPDYFEIKLEDKESQMDWIANHKYDFLCKVCERIEYAVKNDLEKAKLFKETIAIGDDRKTVKRVNIYLHELEGGSWLKTTLRYFQDMEDYERCNQIKEFSKYITQKYK